MAEIVDKNLQQMLPEIEEMERLGLISCEELKALISKMRQHFYRICKRDTSKQDCISYFDYLLKLLCCLKIRRKNLDIRDKFRQIEGAIIVRLRIYFRGITRRFPNDFKIWSHRINFAINFACYKEGSLAYKALANAHSYRLWGWIDWADYEMTYFGDFDNARRILLSEAPLHHPNSIVLQRELFRFELLHMEHLFKKRMKEESLDMQESLEESSSNDKAAKKDKILRGDMALLVYRHTPVKFPADVSIRVQLYHVANSFAFAVDIREEIFRDITKCFKDNPEIFVLNAERRALGITKKEDGEECLENDADQEEIEDHVKSEDESEDNSEVEDEDQDESENEVVNELYDDDDKEMENEDKDEFENLGSEDEENSDEESNNDEEDEHEDDSNEDESSDETSNNRSATCDDDLDYVIDRADDDTMNTVPYELFKAYPAGLGIKTTTRPTMLDRTKTLSVYFSSLQKHLVSIVGDEDVKSDVKCNTVAQYWENVLPLLYHCWSCKRSRDMIVQQVDIVVMTTLEYMTKEHFLEWSVVCGHFSYLPLKMKQLAVLREARRLHPDVQVIAVDYLKALVEQEDVDNKLIRNEYNAIVGQLSSEWHRMAHSVVTANLRRGKERMEFLQQQCREHYSNRVLQINSRLALLWQQYQEHGLEAGRAVYNKYASYPPYCDSLYSTMCLLELYAAGGRATATHSDESAIAIDTKGNNEASSDTDSDSSSDDDEEEESCDEEITIQNNNDENLEETSNEQQNIKYCLSDNPDVSIIRKIFEHSLKMNKGTHHDVWLAYAHFEKRFGVISAKESSVRTRAKSAMEPRNLQTYNDLCIDITNDIYLSDDEVAEPSTDESRIVPPPSVPGLLLSLPTNYYCSPTTQRKKERDALYATLAQERRYLKDAPSCAQGLGVTWRDVLTLLLDGRHLKSHDTKKLFAATRDTKLNHSSKLALKVQKSDSFFPNRRNKYKFVGSSRLQMSAGEEPSIIIPAIGARKDVHGRDSLEAMLAQSDVLNPDNCKKSNVVIEKEKRQAKILSRKKKNRTAGKNWDNLKRPEMTTEVLRDLEVLKLRGVLNPKQRFKTSLMKHTPKHFAMGTVLDNAKDMYSDRLTKKQRKRTIAEQIMEDHDVMKYQKRKYTQIVAKTQHRNKRRKFARDFVKV